MPLHALQFVQINENKQNKKKCCKGISQIKHHQQPDAFKRILCRQELIKIVKREYEIGIISSLYYYFRIFTEKLLRKRMIN